jgi:D-alanine-D-alanine ligase
MRIGLTYDLRDEYLQLGLSPEETAEFDSHQTIEAIESVLRSLGHQTERIGNVHALVRRLAEGTPPWDLVFNIAEGLYGFGREAQVPALLDAFQICYTFSDALVMAITLHKGMTKRVVRDLGIPTPDFAVIEELRALDDLRLPYPLFAKPVATGTSVGITARSRVHTPEQLHVVCRELLEKFTQPVLVETYLPGRELTVGIVGSGDQARVLGVMEVFLLKDAEPDVYSYLNKVGYETKVRYGLAEDSTAQQAREYALKAWKGLGCRDGGRVDFRCDRQGNVSFVEINPLAGLHPVHSDLVILCRLAGIKYETLIESILTSACGRAASASSQLRAST